MQLSDYQKMVIGLLLQGKSCHLVEFIRNNCEGWPEKGDSGLFTGVGATVDVQGWAFVVKDRDQAYSQIQEYLALWQKLLGANLVIQIPFDEGRPPGVYFEVPTGGDRKVDHETRINATVTAYHRLALVPTKDLKQFVDNDYRTTEEIERWLEHLRLNEENQQRQSERMLQAESLRDEAKDRKKSLNMTLAIAVVSILVGVASTVVNVLTYTTARSVEITRQRASTDTTKVMLVMPNTVIKEDSSAAKK